MKKIILFSGLLVFSIASFSQDVKLNGTIYMKHPYITAVNNLAKDYLAKDDAAESKIYADTAKFFISDMHGAFSLKDALQMWDSDFDYYDSIQLKPFGYPDYLHYVDQDTKTVQSWWTWSGVAKKTGDHLVVNFVQFDNFNKEGKIVSEVAYGDFSKMHKD